ncbi:MAG: histidine kinase, partial [Actinobacteria bacterium]|nr:histidine kinase [Actinomycetota bacterium]
VGVIALAVVGGYVLLRSGSVFILLILGLAALFWFVLKRTSGGAARYEALAEKVASAAFLAFFVLFTGAALLWLLTGIGPAVARALPSVHETLHRWGGTESAAGIEQRLVAKDGKFEEEVVTFASGGETQLSFTNMDGDEHNVAIYRLGQGFERTGTVFQGTLISDQTVTYEFSLPPPGTYAFVCDPHSVAMRGIVIVTGPGVSAPPAAGELPSPFAGLALRTAEAAHEGQQGIRAALAYVFSALNLVLGLVLLRLRPRDRTARLLSLGLIGTGAVFNLQAHTALTVFPAFQGTVHDMFHMVSGVAYLFALVLFPTGDFPKWSTNSPMGSLARGVFGFVFAMTGLILALSVHGSPQDYVLFFGVVIPIAGIVSQASRFRHPSTPTERQQSRLLVWAFAMVLSGVVLLVLLPAGLRAVQGSGQTIADLKRHAFDVFPVLFAGIPLMLVAVLVRYRLWDIERVINKTLVYGTLAAIITTVYVAVVVGVSRALGRGDRPNIVLYIAATALVAVAFEPLRERLARLVNLLVYGRRATPYEVVASLAERMSGSLSVDEVLPRMAETAGRGVGAVRCKVRVFLPGGGVREVTWPEGHEGDDFDRTLTIEHRGEPVGDLWVAKPHMEPLTSAEDKLLSDLASQAGLALRNVRLTVELQARLEEISRQAADLRASRLRIVAARDAERRRLERDIHDGAQQQLAGMMVTLRLATDLVDRDPERSVALIDQLSQSAAETLDNLRDLAHGIFPPLLADKGLAAALHAQVRKSGLPVSLEVGEALGSARFDPEVEAAVYFCALEALANSAKHASGAAIQVTLEHRDGQLEFVVADRGPGFDPESSPRGIGLQNMADRMEALGGRVEVHSIPGEGTTVLGRIPERALEPVG